jgi:GGDEF domain-containing protein
MRESYERVELATAEVAALDDMLNETVPPAPTHHTLDDAQLVEETVLPEVPTLRFAVLEDAAHVATAQSAIVAAGHTLAGSASGASGVARIQEIVSNGGADAILVALPGGEKLIDAALALAPRRPIAIAAVSASSVAAARRATDAGADLVAPRPHDVDRLAPILLAAARLHAERHAALAARGSEQLLRARLDQIAEGEPGGLETSEMFQRVLEREIKRARRFEYPLSVALFAVDIAPPPPPPGIRGILRARAGNALVHAIRDIDLATQLDHERFLVLLPYTDLSNAATVARRVIAAVGAGEAVVAAGRSFPPRVVGAVAGGRVGAEPLSFAKLVKDATRALEQARKDGAELAVQP